MTLVAFFGAMSALGPKHILLTDGARGSFLKRENEILFCPALATKVASTAGAGDAFSATFAACTALGLRAGGIAARRHHQCGVGVHPCRHADRPADARGDRCSGARSDGDKLPVRRWKV